MYFFCRDRKDRSLFFSFDHRPFCYIEYKEIKKLEFIFERLKNESKFSEISMQLSSHLNKNFNYFQNQQMRTAKVTFKDMAQLYAFSREVAFKYRDQIPAIFGTKINQEIHFICDNNYKSNGWIQLANPRQIQVISGTLYQYEVQKLTDVVFREDIIEKPLFKTLCFDIETTSSNPSKFPNFELEEDRIIQIGLVFSSGEKYLLNLGPNDTLETEYAMEIFNDIDNNSNEYNLICRFFELVKKHQPDIVTGYNIFGFDEEYIFKRAELLSSRLELGQKPHYRMSKIDVGDIKKMGEKRLQSSGLGKNDMTFIESYGIIHVDLMQIIRQKYNFDSYSLDSVCKQLKQSSVQQISFRDLQNEILLVLKKDDPFIRRGKYVMLKYEDDFNSSQTQKLLVVKKEGLEVTLRNSNVEQIAYNYVCLMKDDINIREAFGLWDFMNTNVMHEKKKVIADYCI